MSKKNKSQQPKEDSPVSQSHAAEYRIIKRDLLHVVVLNALYLALVLAVYFTNSKTHYLENWFSRVLHF